MAFAKYPVTGTGSGDVAGPSSSVNNGVVLFNGTTGKIIKDLGVGSANQVLLTDGSSPSFGSITNAYISNSAAIAYSKLAALTINRALVSDASGVVSVSSVTSTELGYLSGVSSAIQTQLNGKVGTTGNETIAGSKTFSSAVTINPASNQLILSSGVSQVTINSGTSAAARTYTIPDAGTTGSFVLDQGTYTLQGSYTFTQQILVHNVGAFAAGVYRITGSATNPQLYTEYQGTAATAQTWRVGLNTDGSNVGSYVIYDFTATLPRAAVTTAGQFQLPAASNQIQLSSSVNQLTITSGTSAAARTYTIPDAGTTADFVMSAGSSTIAGARTFSSAVTINPASNQLVLSSGVSQLTLNSGTSAAARTYTVPDTGTTDTFAMLGGSQTFGGAKTFSSAVTVSAASNQLVLSSGVNQLTLNSSTSAAARTYAFPDVGTSGTVAMLEGSQTFSALKTFSSGLAVSGGSAANNTIWVASNTLNIRGGTSGTDIYNTSGSVIVDISDAGLVNFGTVSNARGRLNFTNSTTLDRVFLNHEIDSVVSYGIGVDSGNLFTIGTTSGLNTWSTKFLQASSTGACTLGPSAGGVTHRFNTNTSTTATAGSRTLPANPVDFWIVNINGTDRKIPYYAT